MSRRSDFSILSDPHAIYLDHAASSLTPDSVLNTMEEYYHQYRSNVHRGVYPWSAKATIAYEDARDKVAGFIGANASEIAFTQGATASLNLAVQCYFEHKIKSSQTILISPLEHHSNMIPWQQVALKKGAKLQYIPMTLEWEIDWGALDVLINHEDVAVIAMTHASNVFGLTYDIKRLCRYGIAVCVDGTQMVSHEAVDVKDLGCAFYAFSAHKMYGPTGIGALYVHTDYHADLKPCFTGGGMVDVVTYHEASFQKGVSALEAGTPNIASAIGFAKACDYIHMIGYAQIKQIETDTFQYFLRQVESLGLRTYAPSKHPVYSFTYPRVHSHDVATILGDQGVMVRAGHHCCMPLLEKLGVSALTRASFGVYNSPTDVDCFVKAIQKVDEVMGL